MKISRKHSFSDQVQLAKYKQTRYGPYKRKPFKKVQVDYKDPQKVLSVVRDGGFKDFVGRAYSSPAGYDIRINPLTGDREMMIAGTRHKSQWLLNAYDTGAALTDLYTGMFTDEPTDFLDLDLARDYSLYYYDKVAKENNVDVVYGHSRGAALAADMKTMFSNYKVIGLDGAMVMTHNKDVNNISANQIFDHLIGATGNKNYFSRDQTSFHQVWDLL